MLRLFSLARKRGIAGARIVKYCTAEQRGGDEFHGEEWGSSRGNGGFEVAPDKLFARGSILRDCDRFLQEEVRIVENVLACLKLCASSALFEKPPVRVELAGEIFHKLVESGLPIETATFNLLLRAYIFNDHRDVVPSDFLKLMDRHGCSPNAGTLTSLHEMFCEQGNLTGASKLVEYMKKINMGITERIYASLITCYSRQDKLDEAEGVIEKMYSKAQRIHNITYTPLLCAYAERGMADKILATYSKMDETDVFPSVSTFTAVMDTLSKYGHAHLVPSVLALIKNDSWLSSEFRYLCYACLARGELEAPRILIGQLAQHNTVNSTIVMRYMFAALHNKVPFDEALRTLQENIDPSSIDTIAHMMATQVFFSHTFPTELDDKKYEFPVKGELGEHPWGNELWISQARSALDYLAKAQRKRFNFYHYPVLAKVCSDGNVKELVKTLALMFAHRLPRNKFVDGYIGKTFFNSGISIDEFIDSQNKLEEADDEWLGSLMLFYLAMGQYTAAMQTLKKVKDLDDLWTRSQKAIFEAMQYGKLFVSRGDSIYVSGSMLELGAPLALFAKLFWDNKYLNVEFFENLIEKQVQFSCGAVIQHYWSKIGTNKELERTALADLYHLVEKVQYTPDDNELLYFFKAFVKMKLPSVPYDKVEKIYQMISEHTKKNYDVQCYHVGHLINLERYPEALEKFQELKHQGKGADIPGFVWKEIVCEMYKEDPSKGHELLLEMKQEKGEPMVFMLTNILQTCIDKKHVTGAEYIIEQLANIDVEVVTLQKILYLYAELGLVDKIEAFQKRYPDINETTILQARIIALVGRNEVEKALEEAAKLKRIRREYLILLLNMLIANKHSLVPWRRLILNLGIFASKLDTHLVFAYADCGYIDTAEKMLQTVTLHKKEVDMRLKSSRGDVYRHLLRNYDISAVTVEGRADITDICQHLSDAEQESGYFADVKGKSQR